MLNPCSTNADWCPDGTYLQSGEKLFSNLIGHSNYLLTFTIYMLDVYIIFCRKFYEFECSFLPLDFGHLEWIHAPEVLKALIS